ncbi:MAG: hypothetical protein P8016_07575 [Sedimentisphaerales bacterium]
MNKILIIQICFSIFILAGCSRQQKLDKYVELYAMPYSIARNNVSKDQVPVLHKMLRDKKYAPYWHNIARTIGYISDDPNSVYALLEYFQRDDSWNLDTYVKLLGKVESISYLGYIGGQAASKIMRSCATSDGAQEMAKNWIDKDFANNFPAFQVKEKVIDRIRYSALIGLALTGTQENDSFITNLYEQERAYCESNKVKTYSFQMMADVMSLQDYVSQNGTEAYKNLPAEEKGVAILSNLSKYNKLDWVEKLGSDGF